ncbi:MAG: ATP-binding protein [Colwellia sp.]|nr:ATP-binding protein [Colwellia sp.]
MKRVDSIPTQLHIIKCEKHGDHEAKYTKCHDGKYFVQQYCFDCVKESEAKQKLEDERIRVADDIERDKTRKERLRANAGISKRNLYKTFDDYICTNEGQTKAKNDCMRYVENFPTDKSLIMVGGVGTGKTLLASAMIESLVDKHKCEIVKLIEIVRELKATWSRDSETSEEKIISWYTKLDLLIIDEVGSQFGSDTEKLFIFEIIDGRYQNMKPTIIISNLDINGVKDAIGERCVDRLREGGGSMIAFNWNSSRA